jgi:hypothetical protein
LAVIVPTSVAVATVLDPWSEKDRVSQTNGYEVQQELVVWDQLLEAAEFHPIKRTAKTAVVPLFRDRPSWPANAPVPNEFWPQIEDGLHLVTTQQTAEDDGPIPV